MLDGRFNLSEDFSKVFESWMVLIAILAAVIIGGRKAYKAIKTHFSGEEMSTIHGEIHELLTELRVVANSARTQIVQLHNGEYFMDGVSMKKFSITHESLERGVGSCANNMTGVLCSLFSPMFPLILDNRARLHYTVDQRDSYFKQFFESRNIEAFSVLPLTAKNQLTGFLLIHWCNSKIIDTLDQDMVFYEMAKIRNDIQVQLSYQKR